MVANFDPCCCLDLTLNFLSIIIDNDKIFSGSPDSEENKKGNFLSSNEYVHVALQYLLIDC